MSKLFDETRKAQNRQASETPSAALDMEHALATVRRPEEVVRDLSDSRLEKCRKFFLPRPVNSPVIFSGSDACLAALEAYRGLRTRLMRLAAKEGLRSIMVSSAAPGEGKTLTAINLGLCCAQLQDIRVLVVDADLRTRGLSRLIGFPADPGLAEILSGKAGYTDAILATNVPNLYFLGAGTPSVPPPELFAADRWKEFTGWCAETFRLVLIDAPPYTPLADSELILSACDGALAVVKALSTSRDLLKRVMVQLDSKKVLGVVFNGAELSSRNGHYYSYYAANPQTARE